VPARLPPRVALAAALAITGLTGCGTIARVGASRTLDVALSDYRITPQDVDVRSGFVIIAVTNYGRLSHNLVISIDGQPLLATKPLAPGQNDEIDASLAPGQYLMSSSVLSDQALGAYGTLNVG
jgi:hypothetical protein